MQTEYDALMENNTWTLVSRPKDKKVIKSKWVFKVKRHQDGSVDKFKARLVARGDQQHEGTDFNEIFAPVARLETIRTLLGTSVVRGMHIHHLDVITAYVQGDLTDELYMEQPQMFVKLHEEEKVCKLNKPLYGLKQAGREWYCKLDNYLFSLNFKNTAVDPCVYVNIKKDNDTVIIIYVDDLLIASTDLSNINKIKNLLQQKFKMKDLGNVKDILGIHVEREGDTGNIKISQKRYIQDVLKRFDMEQCNPLSTPLEQNLNIAEIELEAKNTESAMIDKPYRELVGSLIYLANATRPDIAFAANLLSRFCTSPKLVHWKMAKRVLRYLNGTIENCISYTKENKLIVYVDSDWAGDTSDRRSCTGYIVCIGGGPISWNSRKQKTVALSTMEAEYMALSEATKETIYIRNLLHHIKAYNLSQNATKIYCDNQSAIELCKNSVYHARSKHIDIKYHFSREAQERGDIVVKYISTNFMPADILTKPLTRNKHDICVQLLNLN